MFLITRSGGEASFGLVRDFYFPKVSDFIVFFSSFCALCLLLSGIKSYQGSINDSSLLRCNEAE